MSTLTSPNPAPAAGSLWIRVALQRAGILLLLLFAIAGCGGDRSGDATSVTPAATLQPADVTWTLCASEYQTCAFTGTHQVKYGTDTQYVIKTFTGGTGCDNGVFGDPASGFAKSCWYDSGTSGATTPPATGTWVACSSENGFCSFTGTRQVRYGTDTQYVTLTFTNGVACNNGVFGDPAPGFGKTCSYEDTGTTTPPTTPTTPTTPVTPAGSGTLSCTAPAGSVAAAGGGDAIEMDTPGGDGTRMFASGSTFQVSVTTRAGSADTVNWQISDTWNKVRASGQFPVAAGAIVSTLNCTSTLSGYFAGSASLASGAGSLLARGTRPSGIATFGVLPDVSSVLPAVSYASQDLHRFGGQGAAYLLPGQGCCDGDGYRPLYPALGLSWANDNRNWYVEEPNGPNTFNPAVDHLASYFKPGDLMRLIQLDGIPAWASPTGVATHSYAPKSLPAYQDYMTRVGQESNTVRTRYFPAQSANYYQVTWEPDYNGGLPWLDTDANFTAMYKATFQGVHSTDPSAVIMGTTNAMVRENTVWLNRLAPLGFAQYLDGVTAHGYYDVGTSPSHPPERLVGNSDPSNAANALPAAMRELRHAVATLLKRGARLFVTETGISYDLGTAYGPNYPTQNVLYAHGAVVARTHLILLGEGADVTYMFYATDIPTDAAGYGLFFDLVNPQGTYGPAKISPKPAALAVAAMTRLIDGTNTLGPLNGLPFGVYGYAFQRLNNGNVVTALWAHNNANWSADTGFSATYNVAYSLQVDVPGSSGQVTVVDMMGNAASVAYSNGQVALALTETPVYVISTNASVAQGNVTTPEGYVGR